MEQCDCVFDFNFLTIFHSMSGIRADVFFFPPCALHCWDLVRLRVLLEACEGIAGASKRLGDPAGGRVRDKMQRPH